MVNLTDIIKRRSVKVIGGISILFLLNACEGFKSTLDKPSIYSRERFNEKDNKVDVDYMLSCDKDIKKISYIPMTVHKYTKDGNVKEIKLHYTQNVKGVGTIIRTFSPFFDPDIDKMSKTYMNKKEPENIDC